MEKTTVLVVEPMNIFLRIFIIIVGVIVFTTVVNMLIRRKLNESTSIVWFVLAVVTLIIAIFPNIMNSFSKLVRIYSAPNLLFLLAIITLLFMTFKHSMYISTIESKINEMAVLLTLLSEENKKLKEQSVLDKELSSEASETVSASDDIKEETKI